MSEPESVFLKLEISRSALIRWLHEQPSPASRWNDWRTISGQWYIAGRLVALVDVSQSELERILQSADATAAAYADNREMLYGLLRKSTDAPEPRLAAFDQTGRTFVAGSVVYAEGIEDFIEFLALARSAAHHLAPSGHGLAIVHNYLWGSAEEQVTTAALRMMPSGESRLMAEPDRSTVAPSFQTIADALADGKLPDGFKTRDQLPLLR